MIITQNKRYSNHIPALSIIIPNFNRLGSLKRAVQSIQNQSYKDYELIVVDDGSKNNRVFEYYQELLQTFDGQLVILEKNNGGVHTARNAGAKISRGFFILFLDSDDEILTNGVEMIINEFLNIPAQIRDDIFEVRGACLINGNALKAYNNLNYKINFASKKKNYNYCNKIKPEMCTLLISERFKEQYFPEPKDVTFVSEEILWRCLRKKYRTWITKEPIRNYHYGEYSDSLTKVQNKTIQHCKNRFWNYSYYLKNKKNYVDNIFQLVEYVYIYCFFYEILKTYDSEFVNRNKANSIFLITIIKVLFYPLLLIKTNKYKLLIK